jgi:uncharacterized membrane protein
MVFDTLGGLWQLSHFAHGGAGPIVVSFVVGIAALLLALRERRRASRDNERRDA